MGEHKPWTPDRPQWQPPKVKTQERRIHGNGQPLELGVNAAKRAAKGRPELRAELTRHRKTYRGNPIRKPKIVT